MKYVKPKYIISVVVIASSLLLVVGISYGAGETLSRTTVSSGGGMTTSGQTTLRVAIGQPLAGQVGNGSQILCSGLLCGAEARDDNTVKDLYLPAIAR